VLVTAWNDNLARTALLQPAAHRFVFARWHTTTDGAGTINARVRPNARGMLLVKHHRYRVTLRLWVTYTPTDGQSRTLGFYGLRLPRLRESPTTARRAPTPASAWESPVSRTSHIEEPRA
jgi:hypothetical protein